MSEIRRGAVLLLQSGDPEIYGALADGIMTARALRSAQDESPEAAVIRKRTAETLRRIDMRCRPRECDDDIETRIMKAQAAYGTVTYGPSVIRAIGAKLLGLYALAVLKVSEFFDFENKRWRG